MLVCKHLLDYLPNQTNLEVQLEKDCKVPKSLQPLSKLKDHGYITKLHYPEQAIILRILELALTK